MPDQSSCLIHWWTNIIDHSLHTESLHYSVDPSQTMCSSSNIPRQKGMLFSSAWNGFQLSSYLPENSYLVFWTQSKNPTLTANQRLLWSLDRLPPGKCYVSPVHAIEYPFWGLTYFMAVFVYKSHSFIILHIPCWQGQEQISLGISVPRNVPTAMQVLEILIKQILQSLRQMSALLWSFFIRRCCSSLYHNTYHTLKTHSPHLQGPG